MNHTEQKARTWLFRAKGIEPGQIKHSIASPDFLTPQGDFEIKRLYGDCIVFYAAQLDQLKEHPGVTILVFDHGDEPVAVIPFAELDWEKKMWGSIRISCDLSRTIRLEDAVYTRLDTLRSKDETYSQVVGRVLTLFDKMGMLRDILEGASAYRKEQTEKLGKLGTDTTISTVNTGEGKMP